MKKTLKQIEESLISIGAYDEESKQALSELGEATDELEEHPIAPQIRDKLVETADGLKAASDSDKHKSGHLSNTLTSFKSHLESTISEHPAVALAIGRLANALSVSGL